MADARTKGDRVRLLGMHAMVDGKVGQVAEREHADGSGTSYGVATPLAEGTDLRGREENVAFANDRGEWETFAPSKGPAKVTTPAYRQNWDRIFGGAPEVGQA